MLELMYSLPNDKVLHALVGLTILNVMYFTFRLHLAYILILVSLAAFSKELYDMAGYGTPDFYDYVATVLPVSFICLLEITRQCTKHYKDVVCEKVIVMLSTVKGSLTGAK